MMGIHQFPGNEDKKKQKMPEFIDLEEEGLEEEEYLFQEQKPLVSPPELHLPLPYRILFLLGGLFGALYTIGGLLIQCTFVTVHVLTFFRSKTVKMLVYDCWDRVCKGAVVTLSLFVAVFTPQFALIVFLSYFMMQDTSWQQGILGRALHKHFGSFME